MTFWETDTWRAYERAAGEITPRAALLREATWETQVVDLALPEADLWRAVRKSYRTLILRTQRDCLVRHCRPDFSAVARVIHAQAAGRVTRPAETWQLMDTWAAYGNGHWYAAARDARSEVDGLLAYIYVVTFGAWAYYFSGVSLEPDLTHALLWQAITDCKAHGLRWFELGWLARPSDTDKDRAISFFKTGFGGTAMPAGAAPQLCQVREAFQ